MLSAGLEPAVPANERPQTHALPRCHPDRQQYTVTDILSYINKQMSILCAPHFTCCSLCNNSSHNPVSVRSLDQTQSVAISLAHSSSCNSVRVPRSTHLKSVCCIYGVSEMLGQSSGASSPHQTNGKKFISIYRYVCKHAF